MTAVLAGGYGMVSRRVMRMPGVSKEAKAVHALICSYTGDKDYCYPTVETLAEDLETSTRSIIRWTEELKAKGLVDKVKLAGNNRRTAYIPLFPDSLKGDTSDTNQTKDDTLDTIGALNHDTGDIITGDTDVTLILTGNTNRQENTNTRRTLALNSVPAGIRSAVEHFTEHVDKSANVGKCQIVAENAVAELGSEAVSNAIFQAAQEVTEAKIEPRFQQRSLFNLLKNIEGLKRRAMLYSPPEIPEYLSDPEKLARAVKFKRDNNQKLTPMEEDACRRLAIA